MWSLGCVCAEQLFLYLWTKNRAGGSCPGVRLPDTVGTPSLPSPHPSTQPLYPARGARLFFPLLTPRCLGGLTGGAGTYALLPAAGESLTHYPSRP